MRRCFAVPTERVMKHTYTIARQFAAGHSIVDHPLCRHQHGHDWTITVTVSGLQNIEEQGAIRSRLNAFVDELRGKNLNDLNPAGTPSVQGIAMWAWERLVMGIPRLEAIEVSTTEESARIML
jgi:6-pyruvoyl-tetrahydropterin synthase